MMDIVDASKRSKMMSGIRGKNTKPEMKVRKFLHANGYWFRVHRKELPGKPDILIPKLKVCVFIHGCFWHQHHGCKYAVMPKTRVEFWRTKLCANNDRDIRNVESLNRLGWTVLVIWECEIKGSTDGLARLLKNLQTIEENIR